MKVYHAVIAMIQKYPDMGTKEIAARVGCRREYVRVCKQRAGMPKESVGRRPSWSQSELDTLMQLRANGVAWDEIAVRVKHTSAACQTKHYIICLEAERRTPKVMVPEVCIRDRSYRQSIEPRDLTAAFCGDPLPGYSALERRA